MSKKKFKKKFRAEIHQQMQKLGQELKVDNTIDISDTASVKTSPKKLDKQLPSASEAQKLGTKIKSEDFSYVKHDIKRIGIIFSIVLLLLLIIYFISIKTNWTVETSNWIANALHIS